MSDETQKARELYEQFGLKRASFIAFDHMQQATCEKETEFWLQVINRIALIDITECDPAPLKHHTN